jgi:hypothetical protein
MNEVTRQPVASPLIIEHAGHPCYLVEYDEDQWNRYGKEAQDQCFEAWAKKAKPLGACFVVLKLFPDAIFPSGDKTAPYVARSYPIEQETFNPVSVTCKLTASIHPDTWQNASEGQRMLLKADARRAIGLHALAVAGCSYEIFTRQDNAPVIIERGRL